MNVSFRIITLSLVSASTVATLSSCGPKDCSAAIKADISTFLAEALVANTKPLAAKAAQSCRKLVAEHGKEDGCKYDSNTTWDKAKTENQCATLENKAQ